MMVIEELSAQRNQDNQNILKHFIPLNALSSARLSEISRECIIEECAKGDILFEQGDKAEEFVYLISGMLGLYKDEMEAEVVVTGSETARFAIAHHSPRAVKAVANSKAKIIRIPARMLDTNQPEEVDEIGEQDDSGDHGGDWMTTMLQSPVFQRLPASNLQKVMMKMEEVVFEAGDIVVKQGDEADYYYIIKSGDCELLRQPTEGAKPVKLAELHSCEAFGEDALLSGNPRNVTVRMKGRGQMLRLSKDSFISLVKEPVLQYVSFEEAKEKVFKGASWLDVRSVEAYARDSIENSVNIPFFSLRMKISELKHDQLQVLVCEKGRASEAAAFLLLKFGFNAVILKDGMNGVASTSADIAAPVPSVKEEVRPKLELVSAGNQDELQGDKGALSAAQAKIVELEKFGASLNEKLNNIELKRNDLERKNGELEGFVSDLQESTKLVTDEFEAKSLGGKERSRLLAAELEKKAKELDLAVQEIEKYKGLASNLKLELVSVTDDVFDKDRDITQNSVELEASKKALDKQKEQLDEFEKELLLLRVTDSDKESLLKDKQEKIDASSGVIDELEKEVLSLKEFDAANKNMRREQQLQIDASVNTIDDISAQLAGLKEQNGTLEDVVLQKAKVELLASEVLENVTSERDRLKVSLTEAGLELSGSLAEQKRLQEELDSAVNEFDAANKDKHLEQQLKTDASANAIDDLGAQLAGLQEQNENLEETVLQKAKAELLVSEALDNVRSERDELKAGLIKSDVELSGSLVEQKRLQEELNSSVELLEKSESQESGAKAVLSQLEAENAKAASEIETLAEEAQVMSVRLVNAEEELKAVSGQAEAARSSLLAVRSGQESQESELTRALEKAEKGLSESERQIESATKDRSDRERFFAGELNEAKEEVRAAMVANQKMESGKVVLEKEMESLGVKANALELEKDSLAEQLEQTVSDFSEKEKEFSVELRAAKENEGLVESARQKVESEKGVLELEMERLSDKLVGASEEKAHLLEQLEGLSLAVKEGGEQGVILQREREAFESKEAALLSEAEGMKVELVEHKIVMSSKQVEIDELFGVKDGLEAQLSLLDQEQAGRDAKQHEMKQLIEVLEQSSHHSDVQKEKAEKAMIGYEEELAKSYKENEILKEAVVLLEQGAADATNKSKEADNDALSALQSELNLVREQTDNDVQFMQEKVQKSEKMNLALKAKIQSMQTLVNEETLPTESEPQEKKKGWW